MKNSSLLPLLAALWLCLPAQAQSPDDHQAAIQKVCAAETQAWLDNDYQAWASTHAHSENALLLWTNPDGSAGTMLGWADISKTIQEAAANSSKRTAKLTLENFRFTIRGDMAFVQYDQTLTEADGKTTKSREHRVLVAEGGQWKIEAVLAFYEVAKK